MQVSGRGQSTVCAIRFAALPVGRESSIYRSTAVHAPVYNIIYYYIDNIYIQVWKHTACPGLSWADSGRDAGIVPN